MTDMKTWEQRVAAWRSSGQSARAYSEDREFSVHMLRYWARQAGKGGPARAARTPTAAAKPAVRLARVIRADAGAGAQAAASTSTTGTVTIEVGGARVAVTPGFDRPTLAAVLEVLGRGGRP